jgi:hypothetical protein
MAALLNLELVERLVFRVVAVLDCMEVGLLRYPVPEMKLAVMYFLHRQVDLRVVLL